MRHIKFCFLLSLLSFSACSGKKSSNDEPGGSSTQCKEPSPHLIDGKCMTNDEKDEHECKAGGKHWHDKQCITANHFECLKKPHHDWIDGHCKDLHHVSKTECAQQGGNWHDNKCHYSDESCKAVGKRYFKHLDKCETDAGECALRNDGSAWENGKCLSKKERKAACTSVDDVWLDDTCKKIVDLTENECGRVDGLGYLGSCKIRKSCDERVTEINCNADALECFWYPKASHQKCMFREGIDYCYWASIGFGIPSGSIYSMKSTSADHCENIAFCPPGKSMKILSAKYTGTKDVYYCDDL